MLTTIKLADKTNDIIFDNPDLIEGKFYSVPADSIRSVANIVRWQEHLAEKRWFTPDLALSFEIVAVAILFQHNLVTHARLALQAVARRN